MPSVGAAGTVDQRSATTSPRFAAGLERNLVVLIIVFATAQALLWSLVRLPGDGGPDEASHVRVLLAMRAQGGFARFEGYPPGAFRGGPVRAQVAYELTPDVFAVPVAATLALLGSPDYAFNVHVARLFNVTLLPLTLWLAYLALRRLFPNGQLERVWGLAFMSAIPMFVLAFAIVTNDSPTIAASTFGVYAALRAWQEDFRRRDVALLGVALGLVALHKYNGFLILPGTAALVIARLWRAPRRLVTVGGALALLVAAIAGWWYVRAQLVYGDALGIATTQRAVDASGGAPVPPRTRGLSLVQFVQDTNWIGENFATFWAGYGLQKLKLPGAAYLGLSALVAAAGLGLALRVGRGAARRPFGGP
ncbi:MAG: glycosyltransferase family 39 protein, partial [Actinobacteria bacterium]|nr:glycosyltransferase family 39 protein [Actinomycetota bacterium]